MQSKDFDTADDWLEQALRAEGSEHRSSYVADDGFTARVMSRLPQPATLPAWRRPVIVFLWLCRGSGSLAGVPGLFEDAFRGTVAMLVGHRIGVADIAALLVLLSAATWGMLIYAAKDRVGVARGSREKKAALARGRDPPPSFRVALRALFVLEGKRQLDLADELLTLGLKLP